jgi:putative endopeptidase
MENSIKLCGDVNCGDNFYNFVNYNWIDETKIPDGYSKWNVFQILQKNNTHKIKNLLNQLKTSTNKNYIKLYIIYSQYLNYENRSDPSNILYIQQILDKINICSSSSELFNLIYNYELLINLSFPLNIYIQSNFKNANEVILHIGSGGLGLPDRDYYINESKEEIRNKYEQFIEEYSRLFGLEINPKIILDIETKLAEKTYTKVQKRIPELNYNISDWNNIIESFPNLGFIERIFKKANKEPGIINITNRDYLKFVNEFIVSNELFNWKQYFCFKIMLAFHSCLNYTIEKSYFNFYHKILSGIQKMKKDWIRSIDFTESLLGKLLGKLYVEKYFDKKSKSKVILMIDYIKKELKNILLKNDWMAEETKLKAIDKLNKINVKIGYSDIDEINYDTLDVSEKNPLLINLINIRTFDTNNRINKLYEPLNRTQWFMNYHAVNAYYSPSLNEIVFPAGILQSPFFSIDQNMGFNFGGIGSIIGHEITHGFDDQGSKYDGNGNLNNWWTEEDFIKYKAKTDIVKKQYSNYEILGKKINGDLTLGENIADIGGVYISLKAFESYLKDFPEDNIKINNFTPKQLFFINYANIWKSKITDEEIKRKLIVDPHSPAIFRVNGVVRNIDDFYKEFNVKETNNLYLKSDLRVKIFSD